MKLYLKAAFLERFRNIRLRAKNGDYVSDDRNALWGEVRRHYILPHAVKFAVELDGELAGELRIKGTGRAYEFAGTDPDLFTDKPVNVQIMMRQSTLGNAAQASVMDDPATSEESTASMFGLEPRKTALAQGHAEPYNADVVDNKTNISAPMTEYSNWSKSALTRNTPPVRLGFRAQEWDGRTIYMDYSKARAETPADQDIIVVELK